MTSPLNPSIRESSRDDFFGRVNAAERFYNEIGAGGECILPGVCKKCGGNSRADGLFVIADKDADDFEFVGEFTEGFVYAATYHAASTK